MNRIPQDKGIDSTLALLTDGYAFIAKRCKALQADAFETRLMLRRVICAMGEDAAAMFYTPGRFTRQHAMPPTALMLLQDRGSVQLLDGDAHRRRKQMFMSLMSAAQLQRFTAILERHWQSRLDAWAAMESMVLQHEAESLFCSATCEWAGVPLTEAAVRQRAREFAAMIDGAGAIGPRHWRGLRLRARTEQWMHDTIDAVRAGHITVPEDSAVRIIAAHRDADGRLLDTKTAAVELLNVLRPAVAIARYVTFAALALHSYPSCRQALAFDDDDYLDWFVQEVRRFYPFFPAVGGRVLREFEWRGTRFAEGTWVLLDLYGTNHDARIWGDPQVFRPERFRHWNGSPFAFIAQGGGAFDSGHRCAGESMTVQALKTAVRLLACAMEFDVPEQDLRIDLARMPALPASRFIVRHVRRLQSAHAVYPACVLRASREQRL